MSYSISITVSGHDNEPHNEKVKEAAEAAFRLVAALPGVSGKSLSGYSGDGTGSITLSTPPDAETATA